MVQITLTRALYSSLSTSMREMRERGEGEREKKPF